MNDYTIEQMKYIDSVDGDAHQSAVEIIGIMSAKIEELKQSQAALISQAMTTDSQNIALNADYERVKKELDEANRYIENLRHRILHGQTGQP